MNAYKRIILTGAAIAALFVLSGCEIFGSKKEEKTERELYTAALTQAFVDAAARPLFKMECPEAGCTIKTLEVANPLAVMELSRAFQVTMAPPVPVPPWWAQPVNTVFTAAAQIFSIKYGLAGVGNIVSNVVGGMGTLGASGFNAMTQQSGQAFAAYDSTMRAGLASLTPAQPNVTNTWNVAGSGNNFGSGPNTYAPISNSYNPVNPAARVCTSTPTGISCTP